MSLRAFLYAADVLRMQANASFHMETMPELPEGDVGARNQQAMSALMGAMANVQGAPKVG